MSGEEWLFIGAVFALAGFVKGVIGLGLPTVAMGVLAVALPPVQAASLLVLPSFLTNLWQMLAGPGLGRLLRRLWPMLAGICLGTWAGAGWLAGTPSRPATGLLGAALALYALTGIRARGWTVAAHRQAWASPLVGALTGAITAATGVFVVPAVPYLQAIGLDKEELVQALGLSFTVSTVALALNLAQAGALGGAVAGPALWATLVAFAGMRLGQAVRSRLHPEAFRRWFFFGLLLLACYLLARAALMPSGSPGH